MAIGAPCKVVTITVTLFTIISSANLSNVPRTISNRTGIKEPGPKLNISFQVRRGASTYEEDEDHTRSIRYDHPQVIKPDTVSALTHALFEAHPAED